MADLRFDRRVSGALLAALRDPTALGPLLDYAAQWSWLLDVQLRRASKGHGGWATLYGGLTGVLHVHERAGLFRLDAHTRWRTAGGFQDRWATWRPLPALVEDLDDVLRYVDTVFTGLPDRHWGAEGIVHAAIGKRRSSGYRVIQREASPSFRSQTVKDGVLLPLHQRIQHTVTASGRADPWWPGMAGGGTIPPMGTSADVLAVDDDGRLLVIEAKPSTALKGIVWAPAQVRFYADLFALLRDTDPDAVEVLRQMLDQRVALGLSTPPATPIAERPEIVPVVAIGVGSRSPVAVERAQALASALLAPREGVAPTEIWLLDEDGSPTEVITAFRGGVTGAVVSASSAADEESPARSSHPELEEPARDDTVPEHDELRWALSRAITMLRRISGDGGVLEQLDAQLDTRPLDDLELVIDLTARLQELTELARQLRADEVFEALHHSDGDGRVPDEQDQPW